ncbi:MAG: thioredoxin [Rikenellaceae bacterium]
MPIMAKDNNNKVTTIHLTKSEFLEKVYNYENNPEEAKYEGDKPALIDFYAVWCGPCKSLAPVLEELAEEYAGEIYIYKVDCEQEREIASYIGVRAYPTLLFIPMEGQPTMAQGALPKAELKSAINTILLKKEN